MAARALPPSLVYRRRAFRGGAGRQPVPIARARTARAAGCWAAAASPAARARRASLRCCCARARARSRSRPCRVARARSRPRLLQCATALRCSRCDDGVGGAVGGRRAGSRSRSRSSSACAALAPPRACCCSRRRADGGGAACARGARRRVGLCARAAPRARGAASADTVARRGESRGVVARARSRAMARRVGGGVVRRRRGARARARRVRDARARVDARRARARARRRCTRSRAGWAGSGCARRRCSSRRGASRVVLASRSGRVARDGQGLEAQRARGDRRRCGWWRATAATRATRARCSLCSPLAGVLHAAGVLATTRAAAELVARRHAMDVCAQGDGRVAHALRDGAAPLEALRALLVGGLGPWQRGAGQLRRGQRVPRRARAVAARARRRARVRLLQWPLVGGAGMGAAAFAALREQLADRGMAGISLEEYAACLGTRSVLAACVSGGVSAPQLAPADLQACVLAAAGPRRPCAPVLWRELAPDRRARGAACHCAAVDRGAAVGDTASARGARARCRSRRRSAVRTSRRRCCASCASSPARPQRRRSPRRRR